MMRLFIPRDTTATALGAEDLAAQALALIQEKSLEIDLVRNGSRGAFWLEPLLELELDNQRLAFGPVTSADFPAILEASREALRQHPLCLGDITALEWLQSQQRITFARAGVGDPLSLADYQAQGGFLGLKKALAMNPQAIVDEVKASGLRGRGGAAFPAGIKWQTVLDTNAAQKYIVCNADEGDSGTFADRLLMESDPFQLLEGMAIAGIAVGATQGFIYLRSEYPQTKAVLQQAIEAARTGKFIGDDCLGSGKSFHIHLRIGAGAYICGEETSLLNSLEGKRGIVRTKPPLPAHEGLFGKPTVVNNVLTLAAVSSVLADGAAAYAALGERDSRGTLVAQLAGNIKRGGLVEVPYGISLLELVEHYGGGTRSGRPIRAIQTGGPLGAYVPSSQWHTPMDYESFASIGAMLGHGGVVVFDDTVDMAVQARFAMEFCALESCGKCTPCRIGAVRGVEVMDRIIARENVTQNLLLLDELCDTMEQGSLCAMGGLTPAPVRSAVAHFSNDFQ